MKLLTALGKGDKSKDFSSEGNLSQLKSLLRIRIDKTVRTGVPLKSIVCNLSCVWCHGDFFNHQIGARAISNAQIDEAVQLLIEVAKVEAAEVKISGQGEPTLVGTSDLCDLVRRLRLNKKILKIKLSTNGILLSTMATELKEAGLDSVTISLNSLNEETYRRITGRDYLDRAIEGVKASLDAGLGTKVNVVYSKFNASEVWDFVEFAGKYRIVVKFFDLLVNNPEHQSWFLPLGMLEKILESRAVEIRERNLPYKAHEYLFANGAMIHVKLEGSLNKCPIINCPARIKCLEGCRSAVRISQDGMLHPCGVRTDNVVKIVGGNTNVTAIRDALISGGKINGGR